MIEDKRQKERKGRTDVENKKLMEANTRLTEEYRRMAEDNKKLRDENSDLKKKLSEFLLTKNKEEKNKEVQNLLDFPYTSKKDAIARVVPRLVEYLRFSRKNNYFVSLFNIEKDDFRMNEFAGDKYLFTYLFELFKSRNRDFSPKDMHEKMSDAVSNVCLNFVYDEIWKYDQSGMESDHFIKRSENDEIRNYKDQNAREWEILKGRADFIESMLYELHICQCRTPNHPSPVEILHVLVFSVLLIWEENATEIRKQNRNANLKQSLMPNPNPNPIANPSANKSLCPHHAYADHDKGCGFHHHPKPDPRKPPCIHDLNCPNKDCTYAHYTSYENRPLCHNKPCPYGENCWYFHPDLKK